ncbi:MAG TPA: S41 family peptidase, partial [Chitinophagaceae bacterium]|nr:S41 family peptidase [Chitinophagaceae bacterium]
MNKRLFLFLLILFLVARLYAQTNQPQLTKAEQKQVIDSISRLLDVNYVFQDVAKKMGALLLSNYNNGTYASVTDPQAFAIRLTGDLQSVSKDKHLNVQLAPDFVKELRQRPNGPGGGEVPPSIVANWKMNNFGFREVKILDGSIAYIDLREFSDPKYAGETAIAAMNFVSNANALIIDLRKNGGGSPAMIQLITSYLFNEEPVHLNNFYFRPTNLNSQTWTLPYVPGKRRPDIDVYVLTSRLTFSAAEEFTYNLKNLKRATVIGEVTGGGANPG